MKKPSISLTFPGTAREAFEFYKSIFGGEFGFLETYKQDGNPMNVQVEEENLIMYVELNIAGITLCGADFVPSYGGNFQKGNNVQIVLNAENRAEADEIFTKLSENGEIEQKMSEEFFGYYGDFTDKFGVKWAIMTE